MTSKKLDNKPEARGRKKGSKMLTPQEKVKRYTSGGNLADYHFNFRIRAVDQKLILENGWNLDIIDIAIFNQMKDFIGSGKADKITDEYGIWYFISETKTIRDLPCVPINSKSAVYGRIGKLVDCGLIERHPTNRLTGKKYVRITNVGYLKFSDEKYSKT